MARLLIFLLLACEMITGCSLQPPYRPPVVDVPSKWSHMPALEQKKKDRQLCLKKTRWWEQYHQLALNHVVDLALRENNDLKKSIAHIDYAQKELTRIKLQWLPTASLLGGLSQFPIFANPGGFAMAAPLYVINLFQQYQQQKAAQQIVFASIYATEAATLMVISQVAGSYFTLIAEKEAVVLYQTLLKDMQTEYKLLKARYNYGLMSEDDLVIMKSRIQTIRAQFTLVQNNIVLSQNALRALINENPGALDIHDSFNDLNTTAIIPENIPLNVIQNRPDVKKQEALLKSRYADVGAAMAALLPTLTVGAYLGSGTTSHGPFRLMEAYPALPLDLSLYPNIAAHKAQFRTFYFEYIHTVRMALRDIDDALSTYYQRVSQLKHTQSALKELTKHCQLTKKRFEYGLVDQSEVIACQVKIDDLRILVNHVKLEKMLSIVKLYQEFAGGYDAV